MSTEISQANRPLRARAPVGVDVLIPVTLIGDEELSRPFLFTVDLVSTDHDVQAVGETRVIGGVVESDSMLKRESAVTTVNGSGVLKMTAGSMFLN